MTLESLDLLQFKNYEEAHLAFSAHVNCLIGPNGSGKTNLLDAIHYLALTKSAFSPTDQQSIQDGTDYAMLRGTFRRPAPQPAAPALVALENEASPLPLAAEPLEAAAASRAETVQVNLPAAPQQKKTVLLNRVPYEKISDHVGRFPVVLMSPYDTDLIREGSETRRRYFDSLLSQLDHGYLEQLMLYNQVLRQRNATLKQFAERRYTDYDYLAVLDELLLPPGAAISAARTVFLEEFVPVFQRHYAQLTDEAEAVGLEYRSQLTEQDFPTALRNAQRADLAAARSTVGPHKDDFIFLLHADKPIKQYGSQGQQKSFAIALKLAQFELLVARHGQRPLLLLDDIFDRLDERRIRRLLALVADHTFGQLFITDSHPDRAASLLAPLTEELRIFHVEKGAVTTPAA